MRFETLSAWLDWQAGLSPKAIDLGLSRVGEVWSRLGGPGVAKRVITIAGTNGKGSCGAMLEAIYRAAGYRVGWYSSPHLRRYNERVRLDGEPVTDEALIAVFEEIDAARGELRLTYFEFGTLAALLLFARAGLDVALLEVGLGGRLDAVNIIDPDVSLITNVALDHQDWLGDDREQIGMEKAGIMRPGRVAVIGEREPPTSLLSHGAKLGADLWLNGREFEVQHNLSRSVADWDWLGRGRQRRALPMPSLRGPRQLDNAAAVVAAVEALQDALPVDQRALRAGLLGARLEGRLQVIPGKPVWVLDVAHNPAAAEALATALGGLPGTGRRQAVLTMYGDKDVEGVVAALEPHVGTWHLATNSEPRGLSSTDLAARVRKAGVSGEIFEHSTIEAALEKALAMGAIEPEEAQVLVFGSFVTVGSALTWLERRGLAA